MDLSLAKAEYLQAAVTSPHTLGLLPTSHRTQKVVVGDHQGVVTCFGVRKGEPVIVFKTMPGPKISRIELVKDKIFVAANTEVLGYSKKGKNFFSISTYMTETIRSMFIVNNELHLAGDFVYSHYVDCKDVHYFMAGDLVHDMIGISIEGTVLPLLACADRALRLLSGSELLQQINLDSPPKTVCMYSSDEQESGNVEAQVILGSTHGSLSGMRIEKNSAEVLWMLKNETNEGGVECLSTYDLIGDGVQDILVGRDDGGVQIYSFGTEDDVPSQVYSTQLSAAITGIKGGRVGSSSHDELIVTTYAGHVIGLSTEQQHAARNPEMQARKVDSMKRELAALEARVASERTRFASTSTRDAISLPQLHVHDKFILSAEDATYLLTIEIQSSIDTVMLQSDIPLDMLDIKDNPAIVSFSEPDPEHGNQLLVTYRCHPGVTRLQFKIRSVEGHSGTLQVYIIPQVQPKTCQIRRYHFKALSLHQRTNEPFDSRPVNKLKLEGSFSFAEIHSWVAACLPDIPERVPDEKASFVFVSTFLSTQLECIYRQGEATFRSDNLTTISILKDIMTREATSKNIPLSINTDINDDSVPHTLMLLHPKLEHQLLLSKKVKLIGALKELEVQEGSREALGPQFSDILEHADELQVEFDQSPCHLERLYGIVTDLFIDKFKFKGANVKNRVAQLVRVLDNYDLDSLVAFFEQRL
eukprot:m.154063 g.154063  ORF g.154063 m.154063 type:complete len:700 (-) comp10185_c0_seq1:1038-3137(-)